jgi:hypothetical protein
MIRERRMGSDGTERWHGRSADPESRDRQERKSRPRSVVGMSLPLFRLAISARAPGLIRAPGRKGWS